MASGLSKVYVSDNISWTIQKGSWAIHPIVTGILFLILSQVFGDSLGLQLTVIFYNIGTFIFFHWIVGDPFDTNFREYTFWEQVSEQVEHSSTLLFMALYPVIMFMVVNRFVIWNRYLLCISLISLVLVVIPKLGFMHMKRIFGIKRFD